MKKFVFIIMTILGVTFGLTACGNSSDGSAAAPRNVSAKDSVSCVDRDGVVAGMKSVDKAAPIQIPQLREQWGIPDKAAFDARVSELEAMKCESTPAATSTAAATTSTSATPATTPPKADGQADIRANGQSVGSTSILAGSGTQGPIQVDTTRIVPPIQAVAPSSYPQSWKQLYDMKKGDQSYIDGVNQMARFTGFNWSDVEKWAKVDIYAWVIHTYGIDPKLTDAEIRTQAGKATGADLSRTGIVRHSACFMNTMGLEKGKMTPFLDCQVQIRVSLAPIANIDKDGHAVVRGDAGVLVDCLNAWTLRGVEITITKWSAPRDFPLKPTTPSQPGPRPTGNGNPGPQPTPTSPVAPPPTGGSNPPSTTVIPSTTPSSPVVTSTPEQPTPTPAPKKPSEAPGQGGAGDGGAGKYGAPGTERFTASSSATAPAAGEAPAAYTPPAEPTVAVAPGVNAYPNTTGNGGTVAGNGSNQNSGGNTGATGGAGQPTWAPETGFNPPPVGAVDPNPAPTAVPVPTGNGGAGTGGGSQPPRNDSVGAPPA